MGGRSGQGVVRNAAQRTPQQIEERILRGSDSSNFQVSSKEGNTTIYTDENGNTLEISKVGSNNYATLKNNRGETLINSNRPIKSISDTKEKIEGFVKKFNFSDIGQQEVGLVGDNLRTQVFRETANIRNSIVK